MKHGLILLFLISPIFNKSITTNEFSDNPYFYEPKYEICDQRDISEKIYLGLLKRGIQKKNIPPIIGNLYAESNLDINAINPNSKAFGLMQWLGSRKTLYNSMYCSNTLDNQLDFIVWELNHTEDNNWESVKKALTLKDKTYLFCKRIERPSPLEIQNSIQKRFRYAKKIDLWNVK